MQFPPVFIAFWAREEWVPNGFIAFSLFIFLGVSRWLPRVIFCDFGRPLGAFGTLFGRSWDPLGRSERPL